ncbi:hypothetical protein SERLADRAFT_448355 [Serpula lacrymans var. lacrymans S7.9]|uniref:CID domain-containing protein n=1 Tax=Serpula lacrymans var. lacrymans (strain S7.9) TaxID=578457 RepID=F8NVG7_SERL9|nr:uncharacterized protein SERLADRAFT_448355 [Serpula lacrymans var. lacrymans S7.9]EGO25376.1 hypothetical protein SERLADRAFT_448355 [Serpula lacrymans var. lacrymans S7.9]
MDKTKSKLAAFFDNDEEESSFPQKTVDDQKLSQYTQGTVRKSRREKEKEALEAKKREEEEHAARAYAEFLDAFEGDDANKRKSTSNFVRAGGDSKGSYLPPSKKTTETPSRSTEFFREESSGPPSPPQGSAPKPKGKRAMDAFLEEIKREQAQREAKFSRHPHGRSVTALAAYEGQSGSKDRGDPETSNVFVANLPSNVTEQSLGNFFARSGPVGSVKIMWPRGDPTVGPGGDMTTSRRNRNSGLSGFVSFMKRKDAENALREFDGYDWNGSVLRVGWSKAVPVAAKPLYVARQSRSRSRSRDRQFRSRSRSSHGSPSREGHYRSSRRSRSRSRSQSPYQRRSFSRSRPYGSRSPSHRRRSRSLSRGREDDEASAVTDTFIRAVAAEVKGQGPKYEANLREWEQDNPKYSFLIRRKHKRHVYYRGLIEREDIVDPEFNDEGYNSAYSTDSAEESEQERTRKNALGKLARKRFEAMLRGLSGKRGELARCMTFSLEHAEAAREICDIIVASLLVDGTPVPRKVARLHLICDILHNSAASVPSAWKFRQEFQSRLGIVFDHLASIYHSFPGRITAETFKKQITSVVDIWEDWIVFPPDFTSELRARLDGTSRSDAQPKEEADDLEVSESKEVYTSRFKAKSFQPAQDIVEPAVLDVPGKDNKVGGEPMDEGSDIDGEAMDNVDGEPLNDDVDGVPIDDIDGAPIDDVDGAPIEDMDGEPMEEDENVDGVPMSI